MQAAVDGGAALTASASRWRQAPWPPWCGYLACCCCCFGSFGSCPLCGQTHRSLCVFVHARVCACLPQRCKAPALWVDSAGCSVSSDPRSNRTGSTPLSLLLLASFVLYQNFSRFVDVSDFHVSLYFLVSLTCSSYAWFGDRQVEPL